MDPRSALDVEDPDAEPDTGFDAPADPVADAEPEEEPDPGLLAPADPEIVAAPETEAVIA